MSAPPTVSGPLLRLRRTQPFFATLALMADYAMVSLHGRCFRVNGRRVSIDPDWYVTLSEAQARGTLLHLVLHAALRHASRRGRRESRVWNVAADIVVNNLVLESGSGEPPPGSAVDPSFSGQSVEFVYESLMATAAADSRRHDSERSEAGTHETIADDIFAARPCTLDLDPEDPHDPRDDEHWRMALLQAESASARFGTEGGGLLLEIGTARTAQLDWRTRLWRFVAQTPGDFSGFDRRFVHAGLYLDALQTESLEVIVAIDTSGSIPRSTLAQFIAELEAIRRAYTHVSVQLWYVDSVADGPHELEAFEARPPIRGGGGTRFDVAYVAVSKAGARHAAGPAPVIYLTDGRGHFPAQPPDHETLWVVTPGGLPSEQFPFGEVARLAQD